MLPMSKARDFYYDVRDLIRQAVRSGACPHELAGVLGSLAVDALRAVGARPEEIARFIAEGARERALLDSIYSRTPPPAPSLPKRTSKRKARTAPTEQLALFADKKKSSMLN
jgi:hypothetical protein